MRSAAKLAPFETAYSHHGFGRAMAYQADSKGVVEARTNAIGPAITTSASRTLRASGSPGWRSDAMSRGATRKTTTAKAATTWWTRPPADRAQSRHEDVGVQVAQEQHRGEEAQGRRPHARRAAEDREDQLAGDELEREQEEGRHADRGHEEHVGRDDARKLPNHGSTIGAPRRSALERFAHIRSRKSQKSRTARRTTWGRAPVAEPAVRG